MPILGKINKRSDSYRLVGVNVLPRVHNYLTLFTLAKGMSKSKLFKVLIEELVNKQKEENPDHELIEQIIARINDEWTKKVKQHPRTSFNEFIGSLNNELHSKGLERKQIVIILKGVKEHNGKN